MEKTQLKIGMPAGSLASASRGGNLIDLLAAAGFRTSGYDKGGPTKFTGTNLLFGWDGRPQEFGAQLEIGELDVAIAGDDWIQERVLEMKIEHGVDINLERVMTLNRGEVQLVGIVADASFKTTEAFLEKVAPQKPLLVVASEMPYLALDWLQRKLAAVGLADRFRAHSVQKYKTPPKIQQGILVYESWGKTESKVKNGAVDVGLEISQTGGAIKSYGLTIVETVMRSQTSVYTHAVGLEGSREAGAARDVPREPLRGDARREQGHAALQRAERARGRGGRATSARTTSSARSRRSAAARSTPSTTSRWTPTTWRSRSRSCATRSRSSARGASTPSRSPRPSRGSG